MSSDEQKQFLNDILVEVERHKDLYRFFELKSVIARRKDIPSKDGKWYNVVTLIKMLHSGRSRRPKKQVEKNDFVILSGVIAIDHFKEILEWLVNEHVFKISGYKVCGPFSFVRREFLDSEQMKRLYDIDWAANIWRVTGKENLGLPDRRSLELESDEIPFEDPINAIRYYTGISLRSDSGLQNAIHIAAPLYYARIKKAELSGRELLVETDSNLVNSRDLSIKYNTEGHDERSQYYKTLEANTVRPTNNAMTIRLGEDAEAASVWLYHTTGFKIDSRHVRRRPLIQDLETRLSQESPYFWDEDANVITDAIISTSETKTFDLATTDLSVDSIDVEILKAIKVQGGDYTEFIPEVLKYLSLNNLLSRLARLRTLGFLRLQPPRKILLTSPGVDALNLPPSVLSARIPGEVGKRIAEIELAFRNEDYDEVTNKSTKLLEALLRDRLETEFEETLQGNWSKLKLGHYDRASLGTLKEACIRLKVFRKNGIADHLISTILQLRIPMSHEKREAKSPSYIALLTLRLIEAFLRDWYYLE